MNGNSIALFICVLFSTGCAASPAPVVLGGMLGIGLSMSMADKTQPPEKDSDAMKQKARQENLQRKLKALEEMKDSEVITEDEYNELRESAIRQGR